MYVFTMCQFTGHTIFSIGEELAIGEMLEVFGRSETDRKTAARIKKTKGSQVSKFKVRCQRHLYTLIVKDSEKAEKLRQSLPPSTCPRALFIIEQLRSRLTLYSPWNFVLTLHFSPHHHRDPKEER